MLFEFLKTHVFVSVAWLFEFLKEPPVPVFNILQVNVSSSSQNHCQRTIGCIYLESPKEPGVFLFDRTSTKPTLLWPSLEKYSRIFPNTEILSLKSTISWIMLSHYPFFTHTNRVHSGAYPDHQLYQSSLYPAYMTQMEVRTSYMR